MANAETKAKGVRAWKVKISGTYMNKPLGDVFEFENVEGVIPYNDKDISEMHIRGRFAAIWIRLDKEKYPDTVFLVQQVHVDEMEETTAEFSFDGKDIKEMSYEELQDLAAAKDLRKIPLNKRMIGLREARIRAYCQYSTDIKDKFIDKDDEDFDWNSLKPLKADSKPRADRTRKLTNDEVLDAEMQNKTTKSKVTSADSTLTIEDMKEMANRKGIKYAPNIAYDALYTKLYGNAA